MIELARRGPDAQNSFMGTVARAILCAVSLMALPIATQDTNMVLTDSDNNKQIELPAKATLTVKLEAQLGTGYGWQIAELDKERLEPVGPPTLEKTTKESVGGRELQVFVFKPLKPGTVVLKMRYVRPWEKTEKPQKTFSATVTIT